MKKTTNYLAWNGLIIGLLTIVSPFFIFLLTIILRCIVGYSSNLEVKRYISDLYPFLSFFMPLVPLFGLILSIKGKNKAREDENISFNPAGLATGCNIFFLVAIILFSFMFFVSLSKEKYAGSLVCCESNLNNIGKALELYGTDNEGYYPPDLSYLTKNSKYMKTIPLCSANYTGYEYICSTEGHNFTLFCKEPNAHMNAGTQEGSWPQYSPSEGVVTKFIRNNNIK